MSHDPNGADQVAAALREALDEDDDGEPGVLNLIVPADPDAGRCTAPETPATPAEPGMRKLEPKRKYDCANCGCGSANDQVMIVADTTAKYVITDVEFCPDCASAYMKGRDEATDTRPHLIPKHTGDCNVWCNDGRCYETKTMTAPQLADELAKVREQIAKAKVILRGTSSQVTQVVRDTLEALEVTT